MRTLASVQTVNTVEPVPNADAIERVRVLGWWVVAKKGEFAPGSKIVYCEIDSLLPERAEFEFLRASSFKPATGELPAGFRIKTVKLRGQVSQGICFPLGILPDGAPTDEGANVTELLGVRKWEAPLPANLAGRVKGGFPGFLPKTDETRVQVLEPVLARHRGREFFVTEKLDGTSFTAFWREGAFGVCSRNLHLDTADDTSSLVRLAKALDLETKLRAFAERHGHDVAVQGEVIGPGVQGNKYALAALALRAFNVFDVSAHRFLNRADMLRALSELDLAPVPDLGTLTLNHGVDELVALSEGVSVLNAKAQREGVVLRPLVEVDDESLGRLSFKAINPKFLLKYDE
jgi:RNA ligase (TIGR02306 family)